MHEQLESLLCSTWAKPAAYGPIAVPDAKITKRIKLLRIPILVWQRPLGQPLSAKTEH